MPPIRQLGRVPGPLPFPFCKPLFHALFWAGLAVVIGQLRAAEVTLPPKADPTEIQAAKELTRVWTQALGTQPDGWTFTLLSTPISGDPAPDHFCLTIRRIESSIGPTGSNKADGFAVTIRGTTPLATRIGVDYFLQHYVGARWFIPGPLGEVIPKLAAPPTPDPIDKLIVPAFASRDLGGLGSPDGAEWAIRNGTGK